MSVQRSSIRISSRIVFEQHIHAAAQCVLATDAPLTPTTLQAGITAVQLIHRPSSRTTAAYHTASGALTSLRSPAACRDTACRAPEPVLQPANAHEVICMNLVRVAEAALLLAMVT